MTYNNSQQEKIKDNKTNLLINILLLLTTCVLILIITELSVRLYYWQIDEPIAANEAEKCLKEMKITHLPSTKPKNMTAINFLNFTRLGYWTDDPIMGITMKKNYTLDEIIPIEFNGTKKSLIIYSEHHHNSQGMTNIKFFTPKKEKNVSIRITLFGDSFTCGGELPLLFGMGQILKQLIPQSEVLNFCVGGRGIGAMYARYMLEGINYSPNVAIFNIYIDDLGRNFGCPILTPNLTINNGHIIIGPREYPTLKDFYNKYSLPKIESYLIKHTLYVYNKHTSFDKNSAKGIELLKVMIDELKQSSKEHNSTLIFTAIRPPYKTVKSLKYYDKLIELFKEKNVSFFDSDEYLKTKKDEYKNQSFYFIKDGQPYGHYSVIGNALYAQGIKNILEKRKLISPTADYYFANFGNKEPLYLIQKNRPIDLNPADLQPVISGEIQVLLPFEVRDANYRNWVFEDEVRQVNEYLKQIS